MDTSSHFRSASSVVQVFMQNMIVCAFFQHVQISGLLGPSSELWIVMRKTNLPTKLRVNITTFNENVLPLASNSQLPAKGFESQSLPKTPWYFWQLGIFWKNLSLLLFFQTISAKSRSNKNMLEEIQQHKKCVG